MAGFIASLGTSLSIKVITGSLAKQKLKLDEQRKIKDIQIKISDFNRRFDDTELDTFAFQKFIDTQEVIDTIYTRIFETHTVEYQTIEEFKIKTTQSAIEKVNQIYEEMKRNKICNEDLFYEYFNDLIEVLLNIRKNELSWQSSVQTAIITHEIREGNDEMQKMVIQELKKLREDNIFADDKINYIKNLIDLYKLDEAEKELTEVLESQSLLSNLQKEDVYYQKARIYIIAHKYEQLNSIKSKIERINNNSKFLLEIDFLIACNGKDRLLFNKLMSRFKEHRYSNEQLLLKEIYFEIINGNSHKAMELLTTDGEIKIELKEYHHAHFYFGNILIKHEDFQKAYYKFTEAFEMHKNIIYKYNALVAKRDLIMKDLSGDSYELLNDIPSIINDFKEIEYITEFFSDEDLVRFWVVNFSLILPINPKDALNKLEDIKSSIRGEKNIQSLFADVYYINEMYTEAKEIVLKVWDFNPENVIKLFKIFEIEKDWQSIIDKKTLLNSKEFTSNPIIRMFYLKAEYKLNGYSAVNNDILPLVEKYPGNVILLAECLQMVLGNNDNNKFKIIMDNIEGVKTSIFNIGLKYISELLIEFSKNNEVRKLLNEKIEFDEELLNIYFLSFGKLNEVSETTQTAAYEQAKQLYNKGIRFNTLLQIKIDIEMIFENWRKAIETLAEYKISHGVDSYYAFHIVYSKMKKHEYDNLEDEISYLLATDNPSFHVLVALLKANQEKWDEAQRIALEALYLAYGSLSKEILMSYISLYFVNIEKSEKVNFEHVVNNSVVFLKNGDCVRKIAIHQNKRLIKQSGEEKFGCENYYYDDPISLILTSEGEVGEEIELLDGKYEVVEILNLYTYFFQFYLAKLQSEFPDHSYFKSYSASTPKELSEQMKETFKVLNNDRKKQLEMYNFGVEVGLPISYLSGENIDSYAEMIRSLLNHETQHLYTGEVSIYNNVEYVLSLSSLILLANFGLLNKLQKVYKKCYISPEIIKCIEVGIKESQKNSKVSTGVLILNEENQFSGYSYTDQDKKDMRRFWTSIRIVLSNLTKKDVLIDDLDIYDLLSKYTLDVDIESIELSKKTNRVLVCDDLFIRKLHHGITNEINTTNFIGFLISENLVAYEEIIDIILKLVKKKYLYPINSEFIIKYLNWVLEISDDNKREKYFGKLKELYKYIFDEYSAQYYGEIHNDFVNAIIGQGLNLFLIYELVREPFRLKPFPEFIEEKSKVIIKEMFELEE
ncbi:PIN domain-containing protein [Peribacillus muralis]|uniref:PIN domain-containing protein n=1 Tax=Peribacillus muralis TaxID=264697 RepID=UPI003D039C8B